jgi:hypothetical protein
MEGDGTAVAMNKYHNRNPAISIPSVCIIDGDSKQEESEHTRVYRLPGQSPEAFVFDTVLEKWDEIGGKLSVALFQRFEFNDRIKAICDEVRRDTSDPHLLYAKLGERLSLIPEYTVAAAFANIWAQANPQAVEELVKPVREIVENMNNPAKSR